MSASMWNRSEVSPPPVASCSYDCYEVEEDDVFKLKTALQELQVSYSLGLRLSSEQYTLNRLLHKVNNQQRQWRWYQMLKKIQKCLNKLRSTLPIKFIEDTVCCCQITHTERSTTIRLPSRQMLEYILVKLMGQAKLCVYILNMAESVYVFAVQNITAGQFLMQNMVYCSIVSRVWVMMRALLKDVTSWYSHLIPWMGKLKATLMQWMTTDEMLPPSLLEWLKPDYDPVRYKIKRPSKRKASTLLDSMFASVQDDSKSLETETKEVENKSEGSSVSKDPVVDLGEPVTLAEVTEKRSKVKLKRKRSKSQVVEEPATKLPRQEVGTTVVDANGIGASVVPSDDHVEKRTSGLRRDMGAAIDSIAPVGKKLKKLLEKRIIKKKLKKALITKKEETVEKQLTLSHKLEDDHPKKKRNRLEILKDKFRVMKKTKKSQGGSEEKDQDVKQRDNSQTTKDVRKILHHKLVLNRLKKKNKGQMSETAQGFDCTPSSKVNAQTVVRDKTRQDIIPGGSDGFKGRSKKKKTKTPTLVCELDKISGTKTATSWTSDIDDIFACLE